MHPASAQTPQGLLAKVAVMQTMIDRANYNGANLGIVETNFIASVAFDMWKWLRANFVATSSHKKRSRAGSCWRGLN